MTYRLTCVHVILVRFRLLSGHLLTRLTICSLCILAAISRFGFEGWTLVLIASVSDLCILFYF